MVKWTDPGVIAGIVVVVLVMLVMLVSYLKGRQNKKPFVAGAISTTDSRPRERAEKARPNFSMY